jgi:hypothetical protein
MGTQGVHMLGAISWLVRWYTRDFCPAFGFFIRPSPKYFFLTRHYFASFALIAKQAGQAVVPHRLTRNIFFVKTYKFLLFLTSLTDVKLSQIFPLKAAYDLILCCETRMS